MLKLARSGDEYLRKNARLPEICWNLLNFIKGKNLACNEDFKKIAEYWAPLARETDSEDIRQIIEVMIKYSSENK